MRYNLDCLDMGIVKTVNPIQLFSPETSHTPSNSK